MPPLLERIARAAVLGSADHEMTAALGQVEDWGALFEALETHGLAPLASRVLRSHLPAGQAGALRARVRASAAQTLALVEGLRDVDAILDAAGVRAVAFKGPVLAEELYGDAAMRPSVDLDFLVRRVDVRRAIDALRGSGFGGGPERRLEAYLAYQNEVALTREGLAVELQWALVPRYFSVPLPIEPFWDRLRAVRLAGRNYHALAIEDQLLALLIHGAKHRWSRLIWLVDVGVLAGRSVDWARVLRAAREARVTRLCLAGLELARRVLGVKVAPSVDAMIARDSAARALAETFHAGIRGGTAGRRGAFPLSVIDMRLRESPRDRVAYLASAALRPTQADWEWLPDTLAPLALVVRPFRLARKWVLPSCSALSRAISGRMQSVWSRRHRSPLRQ